MSMADRMSVRRNPFVLQNEAADGFSQQDCDSPGPRLASPCHELIEPHQKKTGPKLFPPASASAANVCQSRPQRAGGLFERSDFGNGAGTASFPLGLECCSVFGRIERGEEIAVHMDRFINEFVGGGGEDGLAFKEIAVQ